MGWVFLGWAMEIAYTSMIFEGGSFRPGGFGLLPRNFRMTHGLSKTPIRQAIQTRKRAVAPSSRVGLMALGLVQALFRAAWLAPAWVDCRAFDFSTSRSIGSDAGGSPHEIAGKGLTPTSGPLTSSPWKVEPDHRADQQLSDHERIQRSQSVHQPHRGRAANRLGKSQPAGDDDRRRRHTVHHR